MKLAALAAAVLACASAAFLLLRDEDDPEVLPFGPPEAVKDTRLTGLRSYPQPQKGAVNPPEGAGGVKLTRVGRFKAPTYIASPPEDPDLLVVTERTGRIVALRDGRKLERPFLDLSARVGTSGYEQGLLSLAFAPDYRESGRVYVMYTGRDDKPVVEEYRRSGSSPDEADPATRRLILTIPHPPGTPPGKKAGEDLRVHNGGQLQFGPDGHLYVSTGDGGPQGDPDNRGQSRDTLLGKILRIDPKPSGGRPYSIPPDNPFAGEEGARPEVWAYGLRNPYRFSFHPESGDAYIGDVGGGLVEEIDVIPAGRGGLNFGWRCYEGPITFTPGCELDDHTQPLILRPGSKIAKLPVSIIGGYVVRDRRLPRLRGQYVYGEFITGEIDVASVEGGRLVSDRSLGLQVEPLSSFGEDASGRLYVASFFNGLVHRFDPARP